MYCGMPELPPWRSLCPPTARCWSLGCPTTGKASPIPAPDPGSRVNRYAGAGKDPRWQTGHTDPRWIHRRRDASDKVGIMIRIVLVDDQELVRTGLRSLSQHEGDIAVVAEAPDGETGLAVIRQHRPDVVLMDIRMPRMDGIIATAQVVADPTLEGVRVIVLTTFDEDDDITAAIRAGASGYLLKDVTPDDLRAAIRVVAQGESLLSPSVTTKVLERLAAERGEQVRPQLLVGLTDREREVLSRIGLGESNAEIGVSLHISPATARTYVSRLLSKLHARDRSQLVVLAYESGLITPGSGPGR